MKVSVVLPTQKALNHRTNDKMKKSKSRNSCSQKQWEPDEIVSSCPRIESGLRLGPDAITACAFSIVHSPDYWAANEVPKNITKNDIIQKRRWLFEQLNTNDSDVDCKRCTKVVKKKYADVSFDKLGFIDLAHYSYCNLRCNYCGFTKADNFHKPVYEALDVLSVFSPEDVEFDASVDFNGGEPSLLKNIGEYLDVLRKNKIRTRLYTNAIRFSQEISEALSDGTISWLIISVDAGTPRTFLDTKLRDKYIDVIQNIGKYAAACYAPTSGRVAAKYIFTDYNCDDQDVNGFVNDMIEQSPHQIWLLHDFYDVHTAREKDTKKQNLAYAKMYTKFLKRGIKPHHFHESFLNQVREESCELLDQTKTLINNIIVDESIDLDSISAKPNLLMNSDDIVDFILNNPDQKFIFAPAGLATLSILSNIPTHTNVKGVFDISIAKTGRDFCGLQIQHYSEFFAGISDKLVVTSQYHFDSILKELNFSSLDGSMEVILIDDAKHQAL